jgi:pyruvate formate lyase activating enzyme
LVLRLPIAAPEEVDEAAGPSLSVELGRRTAVAALAVPEPGGLVRCIACAQRCALAEGHAGACGVRAVHGGRLRAPFGYVARRSAHPVEASTVFHVLPGRRALSFGMYGCDLHCPYCQSWRVSQALREGVADELPTDVTPRELVDEAVAAGCQVVSSAYNEPVVSAEWVRAVFTEARARGLVTALISDGCATPEALAWLRPVTDVYRVDVKGWSEEQYRTLGGRLQPVLDGIVEARRLGYWVEVVTLVVPGWNDAPVGLRHLAAELAEIDPWMPWHLNAFHPRYRLAHLPPTERPALVAAAAAARAQGVQFVYVGNLASGPPELAHTACPTCGASLVERADYAAHAVRLVDGACPRCGTPVPGLWDGAAARRR